MFVFCPCGKKLKVADKLAGKKVRCPGCEEVFIAEEETGEEKESVLSPKNPIKRPSDEEMNPKQKPLASNKKRKPKPETEDEDDFDDDEEQPRSSRNKRKPVSGENPSFALWRNIIGSSVLGILLIALGVVTWRTYNQPGMLALDINVGEPEVFVDGKKIELSKEDRLGSVNLPPLSPGSHEIKVTKVGFQTYLKQVTVKPGSSERLEIVLSPELTRQPQGGKPQGNDLKATR